jgi:hypothetical protein
MMKVLRISLFVKGRKNEEKEKGSYIYICICVWTLDVPDGKEQLL